MVEPMVTRQQRAMRSGEIEETVEDGGDAVVAADAVMVGIEEATDTSGPAGRLSPRQGQNGTIMVRLRDTSQSFYRANRFPNIADEVT
jgi:hypothetical protein